MGLAKFRTMAAEQEIRRRPLHEEEDEKKDEEDWGVDDEGWTPKEEPEEMKQKHLARRTVNEIVLSFFCHLLIMSFYIHAHVYDATIYKRNAGKGFKGSEMYGGRWKFLTYINFVSNLSCTYMYTLAVTLACETSCYPGRGGQRI